MRRISLYARVLMLATAVFAALTIYDRKDAQPMDLSQFKWKNRLLFLFAPDRNHPHFKKFHNDIVKQPDEVKDRDLVIFEILERGASRMNSAPLDQQTVNSIQDYFVVPQNAFTIILVGKDGGVKMKRGDQVNLADVFNLIDSMPMRQNEMRQRRQ